MKDLKELTRPNIRALKPYSSARDEYSGAEASVFLDANENPYNTPHNRYPDPMQCELKTLLSKIKKVSPEHIFLGNGSDEAIDLVFRAFCEPGKDNVVAIDPTYGMYQVCADVNDVEYRKVLLDDNFQFSANKLLAAADEHTKLIFLCSPNNPTGNDLIRSEIETLLCDFEGLVILDEAYSDFSDAPSFLEELERKALLDRVPIIRKEMQSFLKMFLAATRPQTILEVGTAVGFSTILMCEYGPADLKITTIENYEKRIPIARENFRKAGRESQISLLTGDATEILGKLDGTYDFIFMDAAKGQYIHWLPDVLRLMHKGSILVSDNVLQEGDIIESHYLVERRNRTIYKRMRQYLYELKHNPLLETSILPLGDGAAISVKKEESYA